MHEVPTETNTVVKSYLVRNTCIIMLRNGDLSVITVHGHKDEVSTEVGHVSQARSA